MYFVRYSFTPISFLSFFVFFKLCSIFLTFYFYSLFSLKKTSGERRRFHILEVNKGAEHKGKVTPPLPFTTLENLFRDSVMAHRRQDLDTHYSDNSSSLVGSTLSRSNGGNIKDKISLWERNEPSHSAMTSGSAGQGTLKRTEHRTRNPSAELEDDSSKEESSEEKEKRKNGLKDSKVKPRPCSPAENGKQPKETFRNGSLFKNHLEKDSNIKHSRDLDKENVEKVRSSGQGPAMEPKQQQEEVVGVMKKTTDKRAAEKSNQETRAVFSLFKKLEAMGENSGRTPPELGNYFSPPGKDKQVEKRKKEEHLKEHVYTEPGSLPINPVPKPKRTFQHPAVEHRGSNLRPIRGERNLPPLPSTSTRSSGVSRRTRPERVNINR